MSEVAIGNWIRRKGQKWHLVESVVAGDAVTRCGRRMDRVTASGGELQVSGTLPWRIAVSGELCKAGCLRGEPLRPEDDASTHDESIP